MAIVRQNKLLLSVIACLFLAFFAFSLTSIYTRVDVDAEDVEAATADFDKIASATAAALNTETSEGVLFGGATGFSRGYDEVSRGGLIAGYYTTDSQVGASYWFGVLNSQDTMTYRVTSMSDGGLVEDEETQDDGADTVVMSRRDAEGYLGQYCVVGNFLAKLGFDETTLSNETDPLRPIVGSIFSVLFFLSQGLSTFWSYVLEFLDVINPFSLISTLRLDASSYQATADTTLSYWIVVGFKTIADNCSALYNWLEANAFVCFLPLCVVFSLFTWLVIHKGEQAGRTFKRLFIRIGYTCIAIPVGICLYTTAIGIVKNMHVDASSSAQRIVASVFFDFEKFAKTNLAFDKKWEIDGTGNTALAYDYGDNVLSDNVYGFIRQLCYNQFFPNDSLIGNDKLVIDTTQDKSAFGFSAWDEAVAKQQVGDVYFVGNTGVYAGNDGSFNDKVQSMFSLLQRYSDGTLYYASDYASFVRTTYPSVISANKIDTRDIDIYKSIGWDVLLATSSDWHNYFTRYASRITFEAASPIYPSETYVIPTETMKALINNRINGGNGNIIRTSLANPNSNDILTISYCFPIGNESLWLHDNQGEGAPIDVNISLTDGKNVCTIKPGKTGMEGTSSGAFNVFTAGGLSPIAMYNYLNSSFEDNTILVTSSVNANSNSAKIQHYSVNLAGTGMMRVIFIINAMCSLLSLVILGYYYGVGLLASSFKALFKMLPAVFTGVIGSMRGIASTVIILLTVIVEILGTCLLYSLSASVMVAIYNFFEKPVILGLTRVLTPSGGVFSNYFAVPLFTIVSTVVTIFIISKLIEYRYAICRSLAENAAAIVNKFLETNVSAPDLSAPASSFAGKAGNLALAAAGLAMGAEAAGEDVVGNIRDTAKSIGDKMGLSTGSSESGSTGDLDMDGGTDDGIKNADGTFDKSTGAGLGRTADEQAEDYVNSNKDNFLNNLDENLEDFADGSKGVVLTKDGIKTVSLEKSGDSSVISGDDSDIEVESPEDERHLIATSSGKPYTQEDYENGEAYSIVDGNGNVVDDENGKPITRMNPEGLQKTATGWSTNDTVFDSTGTRVPDFGNYEAPNGTTTHLVNSKGEAYTQADYASGAPATMVDGAGNVVPGMANIPATAIQSTANGVAITTPNGVVTMSPVGTMAGGAVPAFGQYILPNGSTAQVVNASTGAVYSQTDLANGVPATITDGTGRVIQSMSNIQPSAIQAVSNGLAVTAADGKLITMTSIGGAATNVVTGGIATPHTTYTSADMAGAAMAGGVVGAAFNMGYGAFTPNITPTVTPNITPMSAPVSAPVGYNAGASSYAQPIYNTDKVPSGTVYNADRSTPNTVPAYGGSGFDRSNNPTVINNIYANGVPTGSMQQGPVYNISESTGSRGESFSANISENITSSQITASNKANNTMLNVDNKREENVSESSETNEDNSAMSKLSNTLGAAIASAITRGKGNDGKKAAQREYNRNLRNNNNNKQA